MKKTGTEGTGGKRKKFCAFVHLPLCASAQKGGAMMK
jgi:hypothetical protein